MMANGFIKRSISALFIALITLGAVLLSEWTLFSLAVIIVVCSMYEYYGLAAAGNLRPLRIYPIILGVIAVASVFLYSTGFIDEVYLLGLLPLTALVYFSELYRKSETPLENVAVSVTGLVYIALPLSLLPCLGFVGGEDYDFVYPLGYILLIWVNDVGAYVVGMTVGRHRLFERISPKKSWEGFWGGVLFTVAAGGAFANLTDTNVFLWCIIGFILSLTAVAGDLVESMFKRAAGVKDSGRVIPGHGGFLDRFDAMFISLPFVYLLLKLFS